VRSWRFLAAAAVALANLVGAASAQAGQWVYVANNSDFIVAIDVSSIRSTSAPYGQSARKSAWSVWVSRETDVSSGVAFDYRVNREIVDWSAFTKAAGQAAFYMIGGTAPVETHPGQPSLFKEMLPESLGEAVLEAICSPEQYSAEEGWGTPSEFARSARYVLQNLDGVDFSDSSDAP